MKFGVYMATFSESVFPKLLNLMWFIFDIKSKFTILGWILLLAQMCVYLTINHTQKAILYTLSWLLVSAQNTNHNKATNMNSKSGKICISYDIIYRGYTEFSILTILVSGLMMARVLCRNYSSGCVQNSSLYVIDFK